MTTTKYDWIYQLYIKEQLIKNMNKNYKIGSTGQDISQIQTRLGVFVTGVYNTETYRKVYQFQSENDIFPNGIVCNQTWNTLFPPPPVQVPEKEVPIEEHQVTTNKKKQ